MENVVAPLDIFCFRFEQAGGKVVKKTLTNFQELEYDFDIVMNCTGLGAKYLCSDNKVVPIRGQVIKVCLITYAYKLTH
jgi:glycine/D-amino acid oxidase-like deaminating enzyme